MQALWRDTKSINTAVERILFTSYISPCQYYCCQNLACTETRACGCCCCCCLAHQGEVCRLLNCPFVLSRHLIICLGYPPFNLYQVRENATCGDRLTEGVARKLQFLTSKDYPALFSELSEAATAYEVANDQDGAKVTPRAGYSYPGVLLMVEDSASHLSLAHNKGQVPSCCNFFSSSFASNPLMISEKVSFVSSSVLHVSPMHPSCSDCGPLVMWVVPAHACVEKGGAPCNGRSESSAVG